MHEEAEETPQPFSRGGTLDLSMALRENFFHRGLKFKVISVTFKWVKMSSRYFKLLMWQKPLIIPTAWPRVPSPRVCRWSLPKSALTVLHSYKASLVRSSVPQHQRRPEEMELPNISETFSKNTWPSAKKHHLMWEKKQWHWTFGLKGKELPSKGQSRSISFWESTAPEFSLKPCLNHTEP